MGIVNAVDICKYPQHFNRLLLIAMNKYVLFLIFIFSCIGCGETNEQDANTIEGNTDTSQITIAPVTNLKAKITQNPNELYLTWTNPITVTNILGVEIYYKQKGSNDEKRVNTIQKGEGYVLRLTSAEPYFISVVVVDNYGRKSERVTITAIPSNKGVPLADSCTYVLIEQFMDKTKGTFWVSPQNISGNSANTYIYWQQAHAIDVVLYSYERIKDNNPILAATYKEYFERWFQNHGNNYHHDNNDPTGFSNPYTDDMCWIGLTLLRMSEVLDDNKFADTAKRLYDTYIITRKWTDDKGTGLPWNNENNSNGRSRNICTNAPGALMATKLYKKYNEDKYLSDAKILHKFAYDNNYLTLGDGRIEEPPLTYTQGTYGEASRQLYHITNEKYYLTCAEKVISYVTTSDRCLTNGILRNEGQSMDQSIFKAVLIPYIVNLALDEAANSTLRQNLILFLRKNAETLSANLIRGTYPEMYCNYYWGSIFTGNIASMGAQASGASLLEGVLRLNTALGNN